MTAEKPVVGQVDQATAVADLVPPAGLRSTCQPGARGCPAIDRSKSKTDVALIATDGWLLGTARGGPSSFVEWAPGLPWEGGLVAIVRDPARIPV